MASCGKLVVIVLVAKTCVALPSRILTVAEVADVNRISNCLTWLDVELFVTVVDVTDGVVPAPPEGPAFDMITILESVDLHPTNRQASGLSVGVSVAGMEVSYDNPK